MLDDLGHCTLDVEWSTDGWVGGDSISFDVTSVPRFGARIEVLRITNIERTAVDLSVRLSSDEFNIESIYLSHLSLWLLDESNLTLDRLQPSIIEANHANESEYEASFSDGYWTIRFSRPADATKMESVPSRLMLTGSGSVDNEHVEFATKPIPLRNNDGF